MTASIKNVINSASESKEISYDDTTSQLGATNVQDAIEKINDKVSSMGSSREVVSSTLYANKWIGNTYSFEELYPAEKYDLNIELGNFATLNHANAFFDACLKGCLKNQSITALDIVPSIDIPILIEITDKSKIFKNTKSETIFANKWTGNKYSFEESYPINSYDIKIELGDECTLEQANAFYNACIKGNYNTQQITALDVVPNIDIPIMIEVIKK